MLATRTTSFSPAFAPETLTEWLCDWAHPNRKPKPTSVGLIHIVEGGQEGIFHEPWNPGADEIAFNEAVADMVKRIQHSALADVSVYDRPQRYAVSVYSGSTGINATMIATHKFLLHPPQNGNAMVSDMTEGPTQQGVLALSMRLTEATTRTSLMHLHNQLEEAHKENQRLRERNRQLEDMLMLNIERYREGSEKQLRATHELMSQKFEYDMKLRAKESKDEHGQQAWGLVQQIVPKMIENVTKGDLPAGITSAALGLLGPPQETPPSAGTQPTNGKPLVSLMHSLTPEQLKQLDALLSEEQRDLINAAAQKEFKEP